MHNSDVNTIIVGIIAIVFGVSLIGSLIYQDNLVVKHGYALESKDEYYKMSIIDRGYGLYCPSTGRFAFVDEC